MSAPARKENSRKQIKKMVD